MNDLALAYQQAHYILEASPPIVMKIGVVNPQLAAWLRDRNATCLAFITAWNPESRVLSHTENKVRHEQLCAHIDASGYPRVDGVGQDPAGVWREESLAVLGIAQDEARTIGKLFEQNAIVYVESPDRAPKLVWCRPRSSEYTPS